MPCSISLDRISRSRAHVVATLWLITYLNVLRRGDAWLNEQTEDARLDTILKKLLGDIVESPWGF